jgi:hypothetical protein
VRVILDNCPNPTSAKMLFVRKREEERVKKEAEVKRQTNADGDGGRCFDPLCGGTLAKS